MLTKKILELRSKSKLFDQDYNDFINSKLFVHPNNNTIDVRLFDFLILTFICEKHPDLLVDKKSISLDADFFRNVIHLVEPLVEQLVRKYLYLEAHKEFIGLVKGLIIHNSIGIYKILKYIPDIEYNDLVQVENIHTKSVYVIPTNMLNTNSFEYENDGEEINIKSIKYNQYYGAEILAEKLNIPNPESFANKISDVSADFRIHVDNVKNAISRHKKLLDFNIDTSNLNNLIIKYFF